MSVDLRCGRWQDVLADIETVDAIVCDPPYSKRTHEAMSHEVLGAPRNTDVYRGRPSNRTAAAGRRAIGYAPWGEAEIREFVDHWSDRCRGWIVILTSHDLHPTWVAELERRGRYVFAPVAWTNPGGNVRLCGDGPANWTCWAVVSRPRKMAKWRALPGHYVVTQDRGLSVVGGKPLALMQGLVGDYSRPGDLVCDPCSGSGTTARACQSEGRRFVGAEMDPKTHALAMERLRGLGPSTEQQPSLFGGVR